MADPAQANQSSRPGRGAALEMGREALEQWTRGIFDYNDELSRFAMARFNQASEACRALANCRDVGEAVTCEWNYLQRAWSDYAGEAAKQFEFWTTLAGKALATGAAMTIAHVAEPRAVKTGAKTWDVASSAAGPERERRTPARKDAVSASRPAVR